MRTRLAADLLPVVPTGPGQWHIRDRRRASEHRDGVVAGISRLNDGRFMVTVSGRPGWVLLKGLDSAVAAARAGARRSSARPTSSPAGVGHSLPQSAHGTDDRTEDEA